MVLLFLMLLALPLASRAKDTFYIAPVNVVPGESKTITLNLDNSQVFRGFQTDIELPEGLKIASKSNGNFDISLTDRGSSSFSVSSNLMSDGSVRILGYSTQGESIKGNQGALVRISVRAASDFSGGYIKLKNSIFSDVNNRDVKLDNSQLFVGTKEQNDVSVKGGEISPEVSKAFSLELSNESEMTAFQMDVVLPNGLSLDLSKTRLTDRCGNHQLQTKQLGNGKVRIICMSSDNTSISGKIGSVIDLWIKAEKGIAGNQIVKLENIIFSDVKARTYRMDPLSFVVDVKYVPATSVSISESNIQLEVRDSRQLTASLLPENCTDKTILWKSDNEKVATVSDNGMIIARSAGKCSIIVSTADNLIQAKCVVTVVKIPLTAHVANTSKVYGDANPEFNITYSGFRDGDSEVGFSVPASISTIVDNSSKVGKYDIVASGAVSDKYEISYIPGTLTITKAPLSISAGNYTKKQGDAMPGFKASYTGFKNGENESVLTKQPVFSCEANEASAPAEYAVTISGADAENYDISYEQGRLTVVEADAVVVRAKSYSRQYGDDNPVFEFETEGAALDGTPEIVCSTVANSPVGSYTIEVKQGSIKNYNVHFESGSLVITKAPLSISAGNYTKKQGDAMPVFKASYAGFKNGEDESVLTKQPVFSCDANEASAPGEYPITVYGVEADNYEVKSYIAGTLTVLKRELKKQTITWNQEIKAKVGSTIEMNATASSGLPVRYSYALAPGVETAYQVPQIEGNKITFPQNGMYLLVAIQDGNNEYEAATDTLDVCAISDDEGLMYIDGIYYKYTDDGSALKVVRGYNPYRGKVEIPATVNGLPVTEVDGLAMYACYYLKELVIGDNVKKCGHEAFGASINLCNVTLPVADVEFTHNWMFNCDRGIREIHCRSSIPYVVDEGIFNGAVDYDKCILYVPVGTKQSYANSEVWKYFTHIVEENVSTSISNINVEKKSVWYTLQGVKLFVKPNIPGVYIHNGKKIIVR